MSPTAIKLVLSCLWYRNASVGTNMFSDCRNLIALKPINLRWIVATKCASSETVLSRYVAMTDTRCLAFVWGSRTAGTSKTDNDDTSFMPKWYVTAVIDIYMTSPSVSLWKTAQTPPGLPIPVANKIQNAIQYKDWSPDWWCLGHTMTSARARGRSNRLLTVAICNTGVAVVLTRQQDIWDYSFYA